MISLPIVERELRVAARRRGTYRTRMINAGLATLAFAVCFVANLIDPSISFVVSLFWGLSGLCMLYCLAAGRLMTADCLSREKREGTLGLLFLTDLKGYDVVLGKLAATSLDGFYGLLAIFPLLAIPLLAGGLTNGELWRMALVLANTFLFSAAIGLFVSSVCRDERKAMGANLALLLLLAGALPALHGVFRLSTPRMPLDAWFYTCPVYSFWMCADVRYKFLHRDFWFSILVTFILTLLLLGLACRMVRRSWQDKPAPTRALRRKGERGRRWWREGRMEKARAFRKRLLDRNAYFWLAARPYLKASYVWAALGLAGCFWVFDTLFIGNIEEVLNVVFALLLSAMLKWWITTEAGRPLAEDKKSGAFELLLSTPLTARDIVRGQWLALRRQFLKPLAAAVVVGLVLMVAVRHQPKQEQIETWCGWLAFILMFVADVIALGWAAMLASLTSRSHGRATLKTAACILVLPWFLYGGVALLIRLLLFLFVRQYWEPGSMFDLGCWFGVGIFVDLLLALKARRRLQTNFRQLMMEPAAPKRRFAWLRDWRTGSPERKTELRAKLRRKAAVATALLAAGAGLVLHDIHASHGHLPKPLVVSISQSNQPVRVFGARDNDQDGVFFILPDGTLWTWGRQGKVSPPRQIGTNRDWLQVSFGNSALGLRSNGTLWTWSTDSEEPRQFSSNHDWVEVCAGSDYSLARKRDGTLWGWGNNSQCQLGIGRGPNRPNPVQVGLNHDWQAVRTGSDFSDGGGGAIVALRTNGTLWAWGTMGYFIKGAYTSTNYPFPVQLCRESNWVGFNGRFDYGVRNQAGESWSLNPFVGPSGAGVSISAMSHVLSSNAATFAAGPLFTSNWECVKYEWGTNGTLWAGHWDGWYMNAPTPPALTGPRRFGGRADWVSVWGIYQTMIGLTSDGTLWTWGLDFGQESSWVSVFVERLGVIRNTVEDMFGIATGSSSDYISDQYPPQKEPRPLLRMVVTNSNAAHSLSP
jgi:ABC-type Na+ efflux pump permease subunit